VDFVWWALPGGFCLVGFVWAAVLAFPDDAAGQRGTLSWQDALVWMWAEATSAYFVRKASRPVWLSQAQRLMDA